MKILPLTAALLLFAFTPAFATVAVSSPWNGETLSPSVHYVATASTNTCSKGVASMGVYVDYKLLYVVDGTSLNTTLSLSPGKHNTVVEEWDYCGGATYNSMDVTITSQSGVYVTSPNNNSSMSSPVNYIATATSSCAKGVASMGVYVNNQLVLVQNGANLNAQLNLAAGNQHTVVEEWDYCGGASFTPINVTVPGTALRNIQSSGGWNGWGELAPLYDICSQCAGVTWSMNQHVSSPSLSGNATQFDIAGSIPYSDVLWSNPLIGQNTTQGLPDSNHTLLPSLHNFTYDADFFVTNASVTQVIEFDISMYMNGLGLFWGHQCDNIGGHVWDIWDNVNSKWLSTGVPCNLINNGWNHVTIQVERESNNELDYKSITLNGVTHTLNWYYAPFQVPTGWWGITVNYQMDGNYKQAANTTYLDNFSLTYW